MRKPFMNWGDWGKNLVYWEWRSPFSPDPCNEIFTTRVYMAEGVESSNRSLEQLCCISIKKKENHLIMLGALDLLIFCVFDVMKKP